MSPRETIAKAISDAYEARHLKTDIWLETADAVIDALEKMEVTEGMLNSGIDATFHPIYAEETAKNIWRAMVGAMKE